MNLVSRNILYQYLVWHFYDVPKGILRAWRNFLLFNLNFFSVPLLIKTFFRPWRYHESYGRRFDPQRYVEVFVLNLFSRVIGMILRIVLIIVGTLCGIVILVVGAPVLILWILLPLIVALTISLGLVLILF